MGVSMNTETNKMIQNIKKLCWDTWDRAWGKLKYFQSGPFWGFNSSFILGREQIQPR